MRKKLNQVTSRRGPNRNTQTLHAAMRTIERLRTVFRPIDILTYINSFGQGAEVSNSLFYNWARGLSIPRLDHQHRLVEIDQFLSLILSTPGGAFVKESGLACLYLTMFSLDSKKQYDGPLLSLPRVQFLKKAFSERTAIKIQKNPSFLVVVFSEEVGIANTFVERIIDSDVIENFQGSSIHFTTSPLTHNGEILSQECLRNILTSNVQGSGVMGIYVSVAESGPDLKQLNAVNDVAQQLGLAGIPMKNVVWAANTEQSAYARSVEALLARAFKEVLTGRLNMLANPIHFVQTPYAQYSEDVGAVRALIKDAIHASLHWHHNAVSTSSPQVIGWARGWKTGRSKIGRAVSVK